MFKKLFAKKVNNETARKVTGYKVIWQNLTSTTPEGYDIVRTIDQAEKKVSELRKNKYIVNVTYTAIY